MLQSFKPILVDMMTQSFSWLAFALMVITYGIYVHKALFYFGKSSISDWLNYRIIQTVGTILIIILIGSGLGETKQIAVSLISIVLLVLSIFLISTATNQHKQDKLEFAFSDHDIKFLTTDGVYQFIRHPIYTAYVLGWGAGLLFTGLLIVIPLIIVLIALYVLAIEKEEAEFLNSEFADEYMLYQRITYRMIPLIY